MPRTYGTSNAASYSSAPAVGDIGDTYYDTTTKALYVSDGTAWVICVGASNLTSVELATFAVTSAKITNNHVIMNKLVAAGSSPATIGRIAAGAGNYSEISGAPIIICTSSTRPASPFAGMTIYETDTFKTLQYQTATTGWTPPWNMSWGILTAPVTSAGATSAFSALTDIITLPSVTTVANRYVMVTARYANISSTVANDIGNFAIQQDAGNIVSYRTSPLSTSASMGGTVVGTSTVTAGSHVWKLTCSRVVGTGNLTVTDRTITVVDVGPSANPA